jgi:hypothetical protein
VAKPFTADRIAELVRDIGRVGLYRKTQNPCLDKVSTATR